LHRREALGLILLGGLVAGGRWIRSALLLGPDGRWRDPAFLADIVPRTPVPEPPPPPPEPPFAVNTTGVDTLVHLPGVGPVLAERLVRSRADEGPFHNADDLRRVKGIGPKLASRLAPLLVFHAELDSVDASASSPAPVCR
jgi:hypothetical protein